MKLIGIIPAAGRGTRLLPFRYPKELFPLAYDDPSAPPDAAVRLRVVCQDALDCLAMAGIAQAYVIISDQKFEVMRFLSNGQEYGVELAYLHQRDVNGLPFAADCAYPWVRESICVLLLPDTLVEPSDAVRQAVTYLNQQSADVVLGIFPTDRPGDLCPVEFDEQGRVQGLYDKDASRGIMNTWGFVIWSPSFTEHLHAFLNNDTKLPSESGAQAREVTLAEVIAAAIERDLTVMALPIRNGKFIDIGKHSSLVEARLSLEGRAPRA